MGCRLFLTSLQADAGLAWDLAKEFRTPLRLGTCSVSAMVQAVQEHHEALLSMTAFNPFAQAPSYSCARTHPASSYEDMLCPVPSTHLLSECNAMAIKNLRAQHEGIRARPGQLQAHATAATEQPEADADWRRENSELRQMVASLTQQLQQTQQQVQQHFANPPAPQHQWQGAPHPGQATAPPTHGPRGWWHSAPPRNPQAPNQNPPSCATCGKNHRGPCRLLQPEACQPTARPAAPSDSFSCHTPYAPHLVATAAAFGTCSPFCLVSDDYDGSDDTDSDGHSDSLTTVSMLDLPQTSMDLDAPGPPCSQPSDCTPPVARAFLEPCSLLTCQTPLPLVRASSDLPLVSHSAALTPMDSPTKGVSTPASPLPGLFVGHATAAQASTAGSSMTKDRIEQKCRAGDARFETPP